MKKIKRICKFLINKGSRAKTTYTKYYEKLKVNENEALFQSYEGSSISGNVFYLLKEMCGRKEYDMFNKYVAVEKNKIKTTKKFLSNYGMKNVNVISIHSRKYCRLLAQSKFLINNATFPTYFIKKEGQIYINTWHGTPLKAMGRNIKSAPNELGNSQRNFLMSDYLIYPNEFTYKHMKDDYMLDNLYNGEYVISGYPRNSAFFNEASKKEIKQKYNIENKKVIVYMPTWRGILIDKKNEEQNLQIINDLKQIDENLDENTIMYVKLHNYTESMIDYSMFNKIKTFPKEYETYEFLNIADCLITDYSSVFFDYANTGKKIILYAYDKEEYLRDRGMYLDYDKLPFNIVTKVDELIKEIKNIDKFSDYKEFQEEYTKYDNKDTIKNVFDYVFEKKNSEKLKIIEGKSLKNNKKNVLIFAGGLAKNGITTALKGIINNVNKEDYNYILTFYKNRVEKNKETINEFKDKAIYIPIQGGKDTTWNEIFYQVVYFSYGIKLPGWEKKFKNIYKRELKRLYPTLKFDYAIHYTGYEKGMIHLMDEMDAKKVIYVHNDMKKEANLKRNFHEKSHKQALEHFDKIVVVRENSKQEVLEYDPNVDADKVVVAHNFNNVEVIKKRAQEKIKFEESTIANISEKKLTEILNNKKYDKFINIARFSPEKGQKRLIEAFIEYQKQNENTYLILIGGYGKQYDEIKEFIEKSNNSHIVLIKSINNPYPILNMSDVFILSSYYEGLPMTIMEALILEKKVISTKIPGPKEFLEKGGYGYLVEDSKDGILQGMNDFKAGKLDNLNSFDANEFNENALKEFEKILK